MRPRETRERFEGEFTCGGEESGHTIVPGRLADAYGHSRLLPVGDGHTITVEQRHAVGEYNRFAPSSRQDAPGPRRTKFST